MTLFLTVKVSRGYTRLNAGLGFDSLECPSLQLSQNLTSVHITAKCYVQVLANRIMH